jgi:hypothetical protein
MLYSAWGFQRLFTFNHNWGARNHQAELMSQFGPSTGYLRGLAWYQNWVVTIPKWWIYCTGFAISQATELARSWFTEVRARDFLEWGSQNSGLKKHMKHIKIHIDT